MSNNNKKLDELLINLSKLTDTLNNNNKKTIGRDKASNIYATNYAKKIDRN